MNDKCNDKNKPRLCKFGYVDYIVLASTISIALAEEFDTQDLSILASFFAVLSDELALISSVEACFSEDDSEPVPSPIPDVAITNISTKKIRNKSYKRKVYKKVKRKNT